jgi:hypothetical protein
MTGNDFVKFLLRTPLNGFLGNTMLITVTGCRTGRKYSTPVGFYREGDTLWVMSSRDRTWWRNVRKGAPVTLLLKGKSAEAFAEAELDEKAIEQHVREYVGHMPLAIKSLGIRTENGSLNLEDVTRVAKDKMFVKVRLN